MPANLTQQYLKAEAEYRRASTLEEELEWLQVMLRELPKHKGTDKLNAELKQKISKVKKDLLKVTAVYVFGDGPAAGAALEPIKENLSVAFQDVKIDRDDNLVVATARISISNFAQSLEF